MKTLNKNAKGYNYRYTDLAEIHSYLESEGWSYYQYIEVIDGNDYIMTVKIDEDGNESEAIRGCRVVETTLKGVSNPVQQYGASLTYCRRYSLLLAFGLACDDDDAESLSIREEMAKGEVTPISKSHVSILQNKAEKVGMSPADVAEKFNKNTLDELTEAEYGRAMNQLADMKGDD